ncbi:MAG: parallel beta-helix domain-containing protein [Paracoccaceae bacterium]
MIRHLILSVSLAVALPAWAAEITINPGSDAEEQLQEALILAQPGDEIVLGEGVFAIRNQLSLAVDDVTLRGAGMDKSILSFKGQKAGSEGLLVTGNGAVLKDFAVEDTLGDGIKAKGVDGVAFIDVRVEWTAGPDGGNGGYGLYPVSSTNVLLDGVVAIGASDAGIYVGQSQHIIVRNARGEFNVAGLEIENSFFADVHDNHLENNTGGILIFDLPDIPQQGGHHVRVFDNVSINNNTPNFAPNGGIISVVPTGTGMLVMGNADVEVFNNRFENNNSGNLFFAAYVDETEDERFEPYPRRVHIHGNSFKGGGNKANPDEDFGGILVDIFGAHVPHIVWDGRKPMGQYLLFRQPWDERHSIHDNIYDDLPAYGNADFIGYFGLTWFHKATFDQTEHTGQLEPLAPANVVIRGQNVNDVSF